MTDRVPPGMPPEMPPDPFDGDPLDPTAELAAWDEPVDLVSEQERREIEQDLEELTVFEMMLARRGVRGIVVNCADCDEDHYQDWDMVRSMLLQILHDGRALPHEPAHDPDPHSYRTWEYCRGFADARAADVSEEMRILRRPEDGRGVR